MNMNRYFTFLLVLFVCLCVWYLGPLEYCFWVQCFGLAWIILVGLDPTDIFTPPKAPLPQTLKWV